jgi:hypothetical protein
MDLDLRNMEINELLCVIGTEIKILILSFNNFVVFPNIITLINIEELYFDHNKLIYIPNRIKITCYFKIAK